MVCVVGVSDSILDFQSKGESLNLLRRSKVNNEYWWKLLKNFQIDKLNLRELVVKVYMKFVKIRNSR